MAGVSTPDGGGDGNVELNLVPFIDLLSTLVLFLLVTAVWLQISAIPAGVNSDGKKASSSQSEEKNLDVHVEEKGYRLTWPPGLQGKYPAWIPMGSAKEGTNRLGDLIQKLVASKTLPAQVSVSASDGAVYSSVIEAIDAIKTNGAPGVALSTN